MAVTTTKTNKPINPRGNDQSPLAFNRAKLYSGKALDFDGVNDSVTIPNNASLNFGTGDFSVAFIMESSVAGYGRIADKRDGSNGYTLSIDTNKKLVLELNVGAGNLGFTTSTTYADGKTKQVVVAADRDGNANFYINGVLDESIDISSRAGNLDSTSDLFIGADAPTGSGLFYNGSISGVKVFSTALTAAQVSDLYNNPEKVVPTGVDNTALKLWLPMMEGAGTTAYDGSGNGNHGTISGATYVNGVGAPVAQSAVIDWNKGTNDALYSEEFDNFNWTKNNGASVTANATTAPDGQNTADLISFGANFNSQAYDILSGNYSSQTHTVSVWAKVASGTENFRLKCTHAGIQDYYSNILTATTEWQRFDFSPTFGSSAGTGILYAVINSTDAQARDIYFWGFQLETNTSTASPYVRTGATAQTSPVLLPQGLTTGRDITGVNLFENVRKQGALNLDGNSWAEVHDNASLDMTTTATMEAWVNCDDLVAAYQIIMVKSSATSWTGSYGRYVLRANQNNVNWWFDDFTANTKYYTISLSGYNHLVVTKDGTEEKLYINGALVSTQTGAATFTASPYSLVIGAQSSYAENWDNQLAQPRIYNRALTAEEVQRNYDAGKNIYS